MQLASPIHTRHLEETQRIAHVGSWERDLATGSLWWSDESCRIMGIEPGTFEGTIDAFLGSIIGTLIRPGLGAPAARGRRPGRRSRQIIGAGAFTPFFQPIADLWDGSVVGHEALTRFADGRQPNVVFGAASRAMLGIELEPRASMCRSPRASGCRSTAT